MAKIIMTICMTFWGGASLFAQEERKIIREGNDLFHQNDFEKAEVEYRKALEAKKDSYAAAFNLGDALYKQKKYDEALEQFQKLAAGETDKERLGELYHNIGNTFLAMNKPEESIAAYKQSLLNRPTSQETKYNLEFARQQLQQQQQQQQNQNQDQNQENKEQNQDQQQQNQNQNQNQDQNKEQNQDQQNQNQQNQQQQQQNQQQNQQDQNKDQQNQNQNKQDQQKNQQQQGQDKQGQDQQQQGEGQQQEGKISKEDAERLLEALENDEKETQEKVQKQKAEAQQAKKMKIEKNW